MKSLERIEKKLDKETESRKIGSARPKNSRGIVATFENLLPEILDELKNDIKL
jgi:hypothetical protein